MGGGPSPRTQPSDIAEQSPWDEPSPVRPDEGSGQTGTGSERPAVESARGSFATVADDGQTPWLPPTTGAPVVLKYVPPGSQLYLIARPADLLASSEGARSLEALGPSFAASRAAWESAAGCSLSDVRQLILTVHQAGQDFPRPAVVVQLTQPVDKTALLQRWGNPSPVTLGNAEFYNSPNGWSYFVPPDGDGRTFVMGPEAQIRDVIEFQSAAPPLQLAMNKLVAVSDDQRHLTILFSPNELIGNLFRDGRQWSLCEPRKIREPLDFFLGDNIEAGLLSLHFDRYAYAELLMVGRAGQARDTLAREIRGRLQEMPDRVERYVVGLNPHPYWKMVAMRYPQMIRYLYGKTRVGTEGDVAVINAALPPEAVHNLVFASEMALQSSPGEPGTVAAAPRAHRTGGPERLADPPVLDPFRPGLAGVRRAERRGGSDGHVSEPALSVRHPHPGRGSRKERHHAEPADPRFRTERQDVGRDPDGDDAEGQSESGHRAAGSGPAVGLARRRRSRVAQIERSS
jgi:eukaryotic-like serine/threonine-protein kinase